MIRKLKVLKSLDLFGVPYKTQISLSEDEQKSLLGGLITVLLYGLSFAYFIYVINQWQTGKILPGFSSMIKAQNQSSYSFDKGELLKFSYWRYSQQLLDPFDPQNIILLPLGYQVKDGVQSEPFNLLANSNETSRYNSKFVIPDVLQISQNVNSMLSPDEMPDVQYAIILRKCDDAFLFQDQKCASQELVSQFWSSGVNYISFWIKLRQFNIISKEMEMIEKEIQFPLNNFSNTNGQFLFQPVNLNIDDGILFQNIQQKNYLNDFKIVTSQTGIDFYSKILKYNTYISLFMRVDPIIHSNRVTYPKLDQILAEVGSISSSLLMIRVIIILFNTHILQERLINRIMKIHHPFIQTDQKETSELVKRLKQQARKKLIITNIIHDIYDLQSFIQKRYGHNALKSRRKHQQFESESNILVKVSPKGFYRQKSWS